jgi:(1->4)-alpha-D-glucan 1-alpha-D-glucosylmutase
MKPDRIATYRLQLRPGFGFDEAAGVVPYLKELGVSHLYASPYLQAAEGSTHGYDVVDPGRVNTELGGEEAHERMCAALSENGLGQMIDVVPNHMAIPGRQNPWWFDVLENGPSSQFATFFDVDWDSSETRWPNKVLIPVLGDHYGRVLENKEFRLSREEGRFLLYYHDHVFPVDPSSLADLLRGAASSCGSEALAFLAESHARLPRPTVTARQGVERRHRDKAVLADLLARLCREEPEAASAVEEEMERLNRDADAMDLLLEQQNYRLAWWRTANRDLGYRRFFDIKDLAGLRVEDSDVFLATHALPVAWFRRGTVQGLRIDHPDGLRDPAEYFQRLSDACPGAWIVAEKILEPGEKLRNWPIAGTTGYDFLNLLNGLFIDAAGEGPMTELYREFTGEPVDFHALVPGCKRAAVTELLGSELNRLTTLFVAICERHRRYRDYTRHELHEALRETAVFFPVYRSYVSAPGNIVSSEDERLVEDAIRLAEEERPELDPELFRFLEDLLLLRIPGGLEEELAMRFQQLTGPAMAKGVEDTAFYRYFRLAALNEVGGDPGRFGVSIGEFHRTCSEASEDRPYSMLASTTHDTKRSEDVRARLALLSEMPQRWSESVWRWCAHNERYRSDSLPDRNTEYLLYQTLAGAWPIDPDRVTAYMEKAVREAKTRTSWTRIDEAYERSVRDFVLAVLGDEAFCADLAGFVDELVLPGRINSLAQTLVRLTAPGIPDIYQGTELWDLSLVDPDNRRPVDFERRRSLLREVKSLSPEDVMAGMDEGLPKLHLVRCALHTRAGRPELFGEGSSYRPLKVSGAEENRVISFMRGEGAVTVVPRLVLGLDGDWKDTSLELPAGVWSNVLTGEDFTGGQAPLGRLLKRFPVALLLRKEGEEQGWRK